MYTYGLELEAVDFNRGDIILPSGCEWSKTEVTLVNSNGIAVDSTGRTKNWIGGEINTPPTRSLNEQIIIAEKCLKSLKEAGAKVNYRCNTQGHIGGWADEDPRKRLEQLKLIQSYFYNNFDSFLMLTMGEGQFKKKKEYSRGFWSHYKERMVPSWRNKMLMESDSLEEFRRCFCYSKVKELIPMTFFRQGINVHSFFKTESIEFRIFWGTLEIEYVKIILEFCEATMDDALGNQSSAGDICLWFEDKFPRELMYDDRLEKGFNSTKVKKPKKTKILLRTLNVPQ